MTDSTSTLIANLRKAAHLVRAGGDVSSDYFTSASDFALEIDRVADLIERSASNPLIYVRAYFARKRAKHTWCAPTLDLDDYLAGTVSAAEATELGNAIYKSL